MANPGFESGTAGWTCTAETGTGTPAHTGTSALVGTPTTTTGECGQTVAVTAGAAYDPASSTLQRVERRTVGAGTTVRTTFRLEPNALSHVVLTPTSG